MSEIEHTEDPPRVRYVTQVGAALVFVLLGLGTLGWSVSDSLKAAEARKNLGIAPITLLHAQARKVKNGKGQKRTNYTLQFKFTSADGNLSTGQGSVSKRTYLAAKRGDELSVEYDTQRPWNNYIQGTYKARNGMAVGAMVGLLSIVTGMFMWKFRPPLSLYTDAPKPSPEEHLKARLAVALTLIPSGCIALGYGLYRANRELHDIHLLMVMLLGVLLLVLGSLAWRDRIQQQTDSQAL